MTTALLAMAATALLVFGRAVQQQNVIHGHYLAAAMTPFLIAAGEIAVVGVIVVDGWASWPWIGLGGGIGAITAMWAHRAWRARPSTNIDRQALTRSTP
jgi:hypothetical protein